LYGVAAADEEEVESPFYAQWKRANRIFALGTKLHAGTHQTFRQAGLTDTDVAVLLVQSHHLNKDGIVYLSIKQMALKLCCSESTIKRSLSRLRELGLIVVVYRPQHPESGEAVEYRFGNLLADDDKNQSRDQGQNDPPTYVRTVGRSDCTMSASKQPAHGVIGRMGSQPKAETTTPAPTPRPRFASWAKNDTRDEDPEAA
jgi:Helix-turn-helix domain